MNNVMKAFLSISTIVVFILVALASIPADKFYDYSDCENQFEVNHNGKVTIKVVDKETGTPVPGASIKISYNETYGWFESDGGVEEYCDMKDNYWPDLGSNFTDENGMFTKDFGPRTFRDKLDGITYNVQISKEGYEYIWRSYFRNYKNGSPVNDVIYLLNKNAL